MTHHHKIALIVGFSLVVLFGILVSDHFSQARLDAPVDVARFEPKTNSGIPELVAVTGKEKNVLTENPDEFTTQSKGSQAVHDDSNVIDWSNPRNHKDNTAQENSTSKSGQTYVIRSDDSLWKIAQSIYGDGNLWKEIVRHNVGVVSANGAVREGTTIVLPSRAELMRKAIVRNGPNSQSSTVNLPKIETQPPPAVTFTTYTVKPNDYGGRIAQKTLGSSKRWNEIVKANRDVIKNPDSVPVGVTLRIPAR